MSEQMNHSRMTAVAGFFGVSFGVHLAWEVAQMPLYALTNQSFWEGFRMCLYATATGHMLFMLMLYLAVAVIHRKFWWPMRCAIYGHLATWVIPIVIGMLLAVSFELWAVHAVHRCEYGAMPLVLILKVGVTPILQMMIIPLAVLPLADFPCIRRCQKRAKRLSVRL